MTICEFIELLKPFLIFIAGTGVGVAAALMATVMQEASRSSRYISPSRPKKSEGQDWDNH